MEAARVKDIVETRKYLALALQELRKTRVGGKKNSAIEEERSEELAVRRCKCLLNSFPFQILQLNYTMYEIDEIPLPVLFGTCKL